MRRQVSQRSLLAALVMALLLALAAAPTVLAAKPDSAGHAGGGGKPGPIPSARIVCLDAGHGGADPGAVAGGLQESDLTLQIATQLRDKLTNSGFSVIMTRDPNNDLSPTQTLSNTDRANICNAGGATTVLAIHLNASSDPTIDYFRAFYGKKNKDSAFTQVISDSYNLDIATSAPTQFASGVLLKTNAPATLAETVFLTNPDEQALLRAGTRQPQIADALFNGLNAWYATH